MILKSYEIKKIEINKAKIILFYGQNHGAKEEAIFEILKNNKNVSVIKYDEKEFLNNSEIAFERPRDHRVKGVPGAIADIHLEALFLCDDISPFEAVAAWVFQLWLPDAFALMD